MIRIPNFELPFLTWPKVKISITQKKKQGTELLLEQTENPSYKSEGSLTNGVTSDTKM